MKILIIRFSSIGDIVLTSPVVRCLKQQLGAEVHYLTKKAFRQLLDPNPYIDKVYAIDKRVGEVLPELRRENYEVIIDLHKNLRSLQVKAGLWRVKSYSFNKLNWEKWLMVNFKINRLPDLHIVDRYLAAAGALGIVNDGKGLDYFIPPEEEIDIDAFLREHRPASFQSEGKRAAGSDFIAFAIGAAHATKRLPREKLIRLCRGTSRPVVLMGGPGDAEEGAAVARGAGGHVINACGRLKLHQSASIVRQSRQVITHDTGMMHIAAAFRKDIISVWGNTIPEFGMYPYYPRGMIRNQTMEVKGLPCRPCSKIGFQKCPEGHFRCMWDIREQDVWEVLDGGGEWEKG